MSIVCSIGTTEPHHAVGLGLDAHVFSELGVRSASVVAAVSAQDARGMQALVSMSPALIEAQLQALADTQIDAYRIGALAEEKSAARIADMLAGCGRPVVYDPVAAASAGGSFADSAALAGMRNRLLPIVTIVTPNLAEAAALVGKEVRSVEDMGAAAREIARRGVRAVLIKGGHLAGKPHDVLFLDGETHVFADERLQADMRGTGCVLAAALAAYAAEGLPLLDAVRCARAFVREKIVAARSFGGMTSAY